MQLQGPCAEGTRLPWEDFNPKRFIKFLGACLGINDDGSCFMPGVIRSVPLIYVVRCRWTVFLTIVVCITGLHGPLTVLVTQGRITVV